MSAFSPSGLVTSGSHWAVRLGHSRAWVITKSYKNGVFFFQILYSSLITLSSTASSNCSPSLSAMAIASSEKIELLNTFFQNQVMKSHE